MEEYGLGDSFVGGFSPEDWMLSGMQPPPPPQQQPQQQPQQPPVPAQAAPATAAPPPNKDTGDMLAGMTPQQWAAMSNPGVPWQGGEKIVQGVAQGVADIPRRFITEAGAYQPGVRREDYTDIPATGGFGSFGSQPNDAPVAASTDTATALMGGGTAFAQPGAAGIFGGKLAKTADLAKMAQAEELAAKGSNATEIWNKTGWFQGADKQWRFEIPDKPSAWTGDPVAASKARGTDQMVPMGEAFSHPELYKAYPQLRDVEFGVTPGSSNNKGVYRPGAATSFPPSLPPQIDVAANTPELMRSTNLHELQHGVQQIENFARGGNTDVLRPGTPAWDIYQERLKAMTTPLDRATFGKVANYEGGVVPDADWKKYLKTIKNPANFADRAAQQYAVENAYRRQAGEVEARNVQSRADLPESVLQSTPPHVTQDVPAANQIVTMRNPGDTLAEQMQAAARDPALWHGISKVKLPRPVAEMTATHVPTAPAAEKIITPADLQGGSLLPALGDRSAAGSNLTAVGETNLPTPVEMQGGHGYMAAQSPEGAVWASAPSVASRLANVARTMAETTGKPVYMPYTAMGERAVDFSHHVSDTLANMLANSAVGRKDMGSFNAAMRRADANFGKVRDWPGVQANDLSDYLRQSAGDVRNKFAKTMDTRQFQEAGFPSVAEARYAVTDPRLLNVPTGSAGLSISQLDPAGRVFTEGTPHLTYPSKIAGTYQGGFGASVPKEVMYPDLINTYRKLGYEPHQYDYLMARGVTGAPVVQRANQQWVDRVSNWLEQNQGGR